MFKLHCFLFLTCAIYKVLAVPPAACRAEFRWDDCGKPAKPVMYYWKQGSRCEIGFWKGCLPNPNMFADEYECINTCVFVDRPPARSDTEEPETETSTDIGNAPSNDANNDTATDHNTTDHNTTDHNTTDINTTDLIDTEHNITTETSNDEQPESPATSEQSKDDTHKTDKDGPVEGSTTTPEGETPSNENPSEESTIETTASSNTEAEAAA